MPPKADEFEILYPQANKLREADLYSDALLLYERALRAPGGSDLDRRWAKHWVSACLSLLGRATEAIALQSELYLECWNRPEYYEIAFRALFGQIEALVRLQSSELSTTKATALLKLADDGLRWLRDIAHEDWRPALLVMRAKVLEELKDYSGALDACEEAYRVEKEFDPPGFVRGFYAQNVARYARRLGHHRRALEVLEEMTNRTATPLERSGILVERVRVLQAMGSDKTLEALEAARQFVRVAEQVQTPLGRLIAHGEMAICAARAESLVEARHALQMLLDLALNDRTVSRAGMLREARIYLTSLSTALPVSEAMEVDELRAAIDESSKQVEEALEFLKSDPGDKSAPPLG
jgi:tetratricopeptide (TPR) repeat protein